VLSSPAPQINQLQGSDQYVNYLNCANDALANAAATLQDRIKNSAEIIPASKPGSRPGRRLF